MSSAYKYAEGGPVTDELVLSWAVEKYGTQAVYGRALSFHEMRMIDLASNVLAAYKERARSDNWAIWADANPKKAELLARAGKLAEEEE